LVVAPAYRTASDAGARTWRWRWGRAATGATASVAVWCILQLLGLLPGETANTSGLLWAAFAGSALGLTVVAPLLVGLAASAAAAVLIIALTPLSETIARHWVRNDSVGSAGIGAAIALSASVNPDSTISGESLDHLLLAAELVESGQARMLVTTTTVVRYPGGPISSLIDQTRVVGMLGRGIAWMRTGVTTSTRDEAVASAALLRPLGVRRVAVVASPVHTRRACATFEAVGFLVTCVASRNRDPTAQLIGQTPSDRLSIFGAWIYELAATVKYQAHGWLEPTA
jgi:uncharacterized SAM-binding protein YcdF (DUF218 family)